MAKPLMHAGKSYTNADAWRTAKATIPAGKEHVAADTESPDMFDETESPEAVAEQHGPAHEVHIQHDHEGGMHHVHSLHPDGHEHQSQHGSAEEAHEHGKKLAAPGGEGRDSEEGYLDEGK